MSTCVPGSSVTLSPSLRPWKSAGETKDKMSPRWVDQTFVQRFPSPDKDTPRAHNGTLTDELGRQKRVSPFGAHAWAARGQKASLETALAAAKRRRRRRRQPVYNSVRGEGREGESRAPPQKSPTKHIMRAAMKDELFRERPGTARLRGPGHAAQKMAVFTYKMFPLLGSPKERDCHSRWQWRPLKSIHAALRDARSQPRTCAHAAVQAAQWKCSPRI